MGYIDAVKQWFVSKAKPTQTQFHTLFDYLRFKDDPLAISDIDGLITVLQGKVDLSVFNAAVLSLVVEELPVNGAEVLLIQPGHILEKIILLPVIDAVVKIGLSEGGEEILPEDVVSASSGEVVLTNIYSATTTTQVFLSGLPNESSIITFTRKIKDV